MCRGGRGYLKDLKVVEAQLGRKITGLLRVVRRCSWGYPQVILCFPLNKGKPFPTLYWLTCPYLNDKVGELESKGLIEELSRLASSDALFGKMLREAHVDYASKRLSLLKDGIREYLEKKLPSYFEAIKDRGIGGVSDWWGVKCLHAHFAYWLVGGRTPVGDYIVGEIGSLECLDRPKCAMLEFCKQFRDHLKGG